jgi:diguanylate cyclase (GGDEF)-like protein
MKKSARLVIMNDRSGFMMFFSYLKKDKLIRESFILIILLMVFFGVIISLFTTSYYALYYEVEHNATEFAMLPSIQDTLDVPKDLGLFITESEEVTDQEFQNFCAAQCLKGEAIVRITYAPNGVVSQVYPTEDSEWIGHDVIAEYSLDEFDRFQEAITSKDLFVTYTSDQQKMLVHQVVIKEDVFQGIVTIHVDLDGLRGVFPDTIVTNEVVLKTENAYILGTEEMKEDVHSLEEYNIYGVSFYMGNIFHGAYYIGMIRVVIVASVLIILALLIIFYLVYSHQKRQIQFREEIDFAYHHDIDTKLPNKRSMHLAFERLKETRKTFFIAYGNFNNVKFINFKYGFELGLEVQIEAINLIRGVIRQTVSMYHLGGDEFAFIFESNSENEVKNILNRILRVFERDIVIKRVRTNISMSLGVIQYPRGGRTLDELIKNAHLTLSQSRIINTNNYIFYSHHEITDVIMNQDFDLYVSKLDLNLFEVHLMPIVDVQTDLIVGFECLTRAYNEFDELLDTQAVVSSLERNGRIQELDQLVFHRVLEYMKTVRKDFPDCDLFLSVNASALSFNDQFVDTIINDFNASKVERGRIVIELTESYKVEDHSYLIRLFKRLNKAGIQTAIDDFGSGYSSLSYISKFPIYSIKVDKTYVRDYYKNNFNRTLFLTLRGIAEVLNCKLIAEGVDDPDTLDFLRDNGCDWYQGYLYSKGVPYQQAFAMLRQQLNNKKE